MSFTLINARLSPFGRKVAISLIEKNLPYDVIYDVPWSAHTITPRYSPIQQLPILVDPSGEKVFDSSYILEWLELRFPEPNLLPRELEARLEARKRQMLGERMMDIVQNLIFESLREQPSQPWVERQTRKVYGSLAALDDLYSSSQRDVNRHLDLGDIAVCTSLEVFEFAVAVGHSPPLDAIVWRDRYPALTSMVAALESRPSFITTRPQDMDVDLSATVGQAPD